jgi:hypothetical protein
MEVPRALPVGLHEPPDPMTFLATVNPFGDEGTQRA